MKDYELWFSKAKEDFDAAVFNHENGKFSYAAFLYQQAVEKALKSVLVALREGLIQSHDCFLLAKKAGAPRSVVESADVVSPYYSRTRYPDAVLIFVDGVDADRLRKSAEEVFAWVRKKL